MNAREIRRRIFADLAQVEADDPFARDLERIAAGQVPPEFYVVLPIGEEVWTVGPLLGERARITRGTAHGHEIGVYDEAWDYEHPEQALHALQRFVVEEAGAEEPSGWVRHIPSGRRRPGGDASREEVRP